MKLFYCVSLYFPKVKNTQEHKTGLFSQK